MKITFYSMKEKTKKIYIWFFFCAPDFNSGFILGTSPNEKNFLFILHFNFIIFLII